MSVELLSTRHQFQMMDQPIAPNVPDTSSSQDYLFSAIGHSCYFMFHAIFGIFMRVIALPFQYLNMFNSTIVPFAENTRYANSQGEEIEFPKNLQEQLQTRIDQVAKKIGLEKPVILSNDEDNSMSIFTAHESAFGPNNIVMGLSSSQPYLIDVLKSEDHEDIIEYFIAKELSHIVQHHELYQTFYDTAILITEVVCAILLGSIWPLLLIEGVASFGRLLINQKFEKDADLHAIAALGTNTGALDELLTEKESIMRNLQNPDSSCFFRAIVGSNGDMLIPNFLSANSLSTRLAYIREANIT